MKKTFDVVVVTCEHGGNEIPVAYASLFRGQQRLLATHRGWDIGALPVAQKLAANLGASLHYSTTTRLLIDLNRSLHVKGVWSELSRKLEPAARAEVIRAYYTPYRNAVQDDLTRLVAQGLRVLHLSIHSFTPVFEGVARNAAAGILYDPGRSFEATLARALAACVQAEDNTLQVRRNYPYAGYTDGFTTSLRRQLPARRYAGIEIETRQDLITTPAGQRRMAALYTRAIRALMDTFHLSG